jgi:hypothetical protein
LKKENLCTESVTYQKFAQIQGQREVFTSLHWPIQDLGMERRCSLPAKVTCATVKCAQRVPHITVEKCLRVPEEQLPLEELNVQDDLTYTEYPVKILDTLERITRSKRIRMCKFQWSHHAEDEATGE